MTRFTYVARSRDGRTLQGSREAGSEAMVLDHLRASGLLVIAIKPARLAESVRRDLGLWRLLRPRPVDIEVELRQVATMLRSGLPLLSALRTCAAQSERRSLAEVWRAVSRGVQSGSSFSTALLAHPCFPPIVTSLAAVGERTGHLDVSLERAADAMELRRQRRTAIVTALAYPAIVLVIACATTAYMTIVLIPRLAAFLKSLGRKLPATTQFLLDVSSFIGAHAIEIGVILAVVAAALALIWFSRARGRLIDPIILRIPLIAKITRLSATATFAHNLSLLLASGVRVTDGLEVVAPLLPNERLRVAVGRARERVMQGSGLAEALAEEGGVFGTMLTNMVSVGETSGTLDGVLVEVAEFHDKRLQALIARLGTIIEPLIVILIGGIVGFVYLAFFMAIYSVAGG